MLEGLKGLLGIGRGGPVAGPVPRVRAMARPAYEAGATGTPRSAAWRPADAGPVASTMALPMIRARARDAYRNDGWAKQICEAWVDDAVGFGFTPRSRAKDATLRSQIQALWSEWAETAGAAGEDFAEVTCGVVRELLISGESFVRLRSRRPEDKLPVPFALELVDPARIPFDLTRDLGNGAAIVQGIEHDALGRVVAYHVSDNVPGEPVLVAGDLTPRRVPASGMLHVFDKTRGQGRGIPALAQSLVRLRSLDLWDDATLQRLQISNIFAGFVKGSASEGTDVHPLTGLAADDTTAEGRPVLRLQGGLLQELGPGEELQFSDPPDPPANTDFSKQQLRAACAAAGIPYEVVSHEWSQNDRLARIILNGWHRRVSRLQWSCLIPRFLRPTWRTFIGLSGITGPLEDPDWKKAVWAAPAWPYVHPVQEVTAAVSAIRGGLVPRSAVIAEATGEDAEMVDAAIAADQQRADRLGLALDSDGRKAKGGA